MKKIYAIPGFGVDEKIFSHLELDAELKCINWLMPDAQESIQAYAARMAAAIDTPDAVLLGVSFGGMMAIEIAKQRPLRQLILISSVKTRSELPLYYLWAAKTRLYKLLPLQLLQQNKLVYFFANKRLGARTPEEKQFAAAYRANAQLPYVKWSLQQILNWQNRDYPEGLIHIHGDADRILPIRRLQPTHIIRGGTHMMVFNRAAEISALINARLRKSNGNRLAARPTVHCWFSTKILYFYARLNRKWCLPN